MNNKVYIGALISSDELRHSAKGSQWKDHKYVKKENGRYYYPEDIAKNNSKAGGKNPKEEDIVAVEEAYKQATEEYKAAKKAYDNDPSEENKKKYDEASKKLDLAGTGQGYADAYRKKNGQKLGLKDAAKEEAKRHVSNGVMKLIPTGKAAENEAEITRGGRRDHGIAGKKRRDARKAEKEAKKQEVVTRSMPGSSSGPISREKNLLSGTASINAHRVKKRK